MKKGLFTSLLIIFCCAISFAQTIYETIDSQKLDETRELKIQLPRNYESNVEKRYPIVLVLDGDYLFEPVAGNVDYYSYWEEMPEAIVVGINHKGNRNRDTSYDKENYLPADKGAAFFEFLGMELMPFIDEKYRTAKFAVIIGHDFTANFINYYLLKNSPLFKGYINLSPDFAPFMTERVANALSGTSEKLWYYQATGSDDIKALRESITELDAQLKEVKNDKLYYSFDNFEGASHYSLVGLAIPKALQNFFATYRPITKKEYDEVILPLETSAYDYLVDKYETIKDLYGLEKQIRVEDFLAIASALEKKEQWDELEDLGDLARKEHPNSMLGNYYLARSYEENGNPKKAMRTYQNAYMLDEVAFLTKDMVLQKAEQIKADFGY